MSMSEDKQQNSKRSNDKGKESTRSFDGSALGPGAQIGPFRIEQELSRGAMGVVYLAQDTNLDRPVAIKSLPAELLEHTAARTRFMREARTLASLNHPNIATIYEELQQAEGVEYLILEYVRGQTLAERIARARLKPQEALSIAQQIAEAIAAAHENGIIHRDLKPGNIKITPEGRIKVLDFGLAKALGYEAGDEDSAVTKPGRIMGTPAYMSPEQVRGLETDERCDIWSFGCVLYEMLAGKVPFEGDTVSDTLASVLDREPDWHALPESTPANVQVLLRRCLKKDTRKRLHDIADAVIEINETLTGDLEAFALREEFLGLPGKVAPTSRLLRGDVVLVALACFIAGVLIASYIHKKRLRPSSPEPRGALWLPPLKVPTELYSGASPNCFVAISPDGTRMVYVGALDDGDPQLYMWSQDNPQFKPIGGTRNAHNPFFSPDSQSVGFFTREKELKRVSVDGGEPQTLLKDIPGGIFAFGSWADDRTIVVSDPNGDRGLRRIPENGGQAETLVPPDSENYEDSYCYPQVLPASKVILYTHVDPNIARTSCIKAFSLDTKESRLVLNGVSYARYVSSGHLIFVRNNVLMVAPFDLEQLKPGPGIPLPVKGDVGFDVGERTPQITVSDTGTILYVSDSQPRKRELVWVDRQGKLTSLEAEARAYEGPSLSPDGRHIAVGIRSQKDTNIRVYVYDIKLKRFTPLTTEGESCYPQWSPDKKKRIAFWGWTRGTEEKGLFCKGVGATDPNRLASEPSPGGYLHPYSWSKNLLACTAWDPNTMEDTWVVYTDGRQEPERILYTKNREYNPAFSPPDGRWLAYVSDESGQPEIYLWEYPDSRQKWPVTTNGATNPVWSRDGQKLYYISDDNMMMAVTVAPELDYPVGKPEPLFRLPTLIESRSRFLLKSYDVSDDGRFLMLKRSDDAEDQLIIGQNWFEQLKRLAPPGEE
jgi:serine/threonine-protein kinase